MLKIIKKYQKQYIELLKEFKNQKEKTIDDYYLIFDKVELLYKRNKKTIFNYIENNKNFAFYGGATYFNQKRQEIYPILMANKILVVADPILKLSLFIRKPQFINKERIEEIIDRAIENSIDIEQELKECYIIYINPDEFLNDLKDDIRKTAEDLTLQYLNNNLNTNFNGLDNLIKEYNLYDYDKLMQKFPRLNELVQTVDAEPGDTLKDKIYKNFYYSGMNVEGLSDIVKIIITLTGLFGQAFELKTISLILNVPLYINRANVLMYLNFINQINEEDKENIFETNILFSLFIFFRDYEFIDDYKKIEDYTITNNIYKRVLEKCDKEKLSIESYLKEIEKIINDNKVTNKPFARRNDKNVI